MRTIEDIEADKGSVRVAELLLLLLSALFTLRRGGDVVQEGSHVVIGHGVRHGQVAAVKAPWLAHVLPVAT